MANYSSEIAGIESILNAGADTVLIDGQRVSYDLEALRKRLRELRDLDDTSVSRRRPPYMNVNLSSF